MTYTIHIGGFFSCIQYELGTGANRPITERESRNRNSGAAVGTIFRFIKGFYGRKQACYIYVSLQKGSLKI
jgi:hypothetical protein